MKSSGLRVARVRFVGDRPYPKLYDYWCDLGSVKEGDLLFVCARGELKLVECEQITTHSSLANKFILGKVNTAQLKAKHAEYERQSAATRRRAEIMLLKDQLARLENEYAFKQRELECKLANQSLGELI